MTFEQPFTCEFETMGMPARIAMHAPDAEDLARQAIAALTAIDEMFSTYRDDSVITRLGRGELSVDDLPHDVVAVLELCEVIRESTGGAFDIRAAAKIGPARELQGPEGIEPSGLVKGWAIDRVATYFHEHRVEHFYVEIAGDVYLSGLPRSERHWQIAVQHPYNPQAALGVVDMRGFSAIATSATYARGEHIIRRNEELASVTVIGHDIVLADAYATAVFSMGLRGIDWLSGQQGFEFIVVDASSRMHLSGGAADLML